MKVKYVVVRTECVCIGSDYADIWFFEEEPKVSDFQDEDISNFTIFEVARSGDLQMPETPVQVKWSR